jgi:ATP-dependent exoDNAse (exonuclease V) alpha subunit
VKTMADNFNAANLNGRLEQIANTLYETELLSLQNRELLFGDKTLIEENDENINCFAENIENIAKRVESIYEAQSDIYKRL